MSAGYMRGCTGKKRHETEDEAKRHRSHLVAVSGLPVSKFHIYDCEQCRGLHVGRARKVMCTRRRRSGKRPNKRLRGRV